MSKFTDHLGRPIVAITGVGVVSSLGKGKDENWAKLTAGESGIHRIDRFSTDGLKTSVAGTVDFMELDTHSAPALSLALARTATREAVDQASIDGEKFPGPLFLAAPPVEMEWQHRFALDQEVDEGEGYGRLLAAARKGDHSDLYEMLQFNWIADTLEEEFGTDGLPVSLSTACASGTTAVQMGVEAIRRGETNAALCVGTDGSVTTESLIRFSLLSALTTQNEDPTKAAKPFSKDRDGFVMAEGAGALVLESLESATARGAEVLAIVRGCGEKADHFHRTRSSPDGSPVIAAVSLALEDAGVAVDEIDYINAHGTSTPENDRMEYNSLKAVFGDAIHTTPISSNKSMIGHTLTAAGAIEAVFSVLTLQNGLMPPTINYGNPDPDIPLDVVPDKAREATVRNVLSNSFGFGGQNACLVLSQPNG
ncbi:beta-ketoacyl-ACP synthase [Ahrensia sp. R2A130]|uniref:beta-ketoacyl-ACP synthase n=1 Tax=Ahrensia sp. R2A130 TaxID=744979 RepID=UPI0001E0AC45|nr:beta-ketoacyl-ACP synthase [Ahrensia sp. R2A130]EFL90097.1 beta-ketoacyl-acyl-carrier-protein synthase II [Ahrensia sp. R2A130]